MTDPIEFKEYHSFLKAEKRASRIKLVALAIGGFSFAVIIGISAIWVYNRSLTSDASAVVQASNSSSASETDTLVHVSFSMCSMIRRNNCVIDGDTIWLNGRKIRIADIDAPEKSEPKCESEQELALQATARLLELVNQGPIELRPIGTRDKDRYGRDLRIVLINGQSVGNMLVLEGLARTWTGRREPWC